MIGIHNWIGTGKVVSFIYISLTFVNLKYIVETLRLRVELKFLGIKTIHFYF